MINKYKAFQKIGLLALLAIMISGCNEDNFNDNTTVPYVTVNLSLNLDNPLYSTLQFIGNSLEIDNQGSRGIIVTHPRTEEYYAFDRHCPFDHTNPCARVSVERNSFFVRCGEYNNNNEFVPCCNSKYSIEGYFLEGDCQCNSLRLYRVTQQGNTLYITNR